jgi:hypothetical protein
MGDEKSPPAPRTDDVRKASPPPADAPQVHPAQALQDAVGNAGVQQSLGQGARSGTANLAADRPSALDAAESLLKWGAGGLLPAVAVRAARSNLFESEIELKGSGTLDPSLSIRSYIGLVGGSVGVRFGDLASGRMVITRDSNGYQAKLQPLRMRHPFLEPRDPKEELILAVKVVDSKVTGAIGVGYGLPAELRPGVTYFASQDRLIPMIFGRSYVDKYSLPHLALTNELRDGQLRLSAGFILNPPDGPSIVGGFSLLDEIGIMEAKLQVFGAGMAPTQVPVDRTPKGLITARKPIEFSQGWKTQGFEGLLTASYVDGSFEARGQIDFAFPRGAASPKLAGQITVVATTLDRAWEMAHSHSPTPLLTPGLQPSPLGTGFALTGWGTLTALIAPGITANATFIVDPDGYLTARGVLRAPREIVILDGYPWEGPNLVPPGYRSWILADIPVFFGASVRGSVNVSLQPTANIGPFTLRDIVIQGQYSTRPGVGTDLDIAASLNASMSAALEAKAAFEASARVGFKLDLYFWEPDLSLSVVSVDLNAVGKATLEAYVNARPRIRRQSGGAAGDDPRYWIGGRLEAGGQFVLDVSLGAGIDLFGILKKSLSFSVVRYPIAGGSFAVDFEHELGTPWDFSKARFSTGAFNARNFVGAIRGKTAAPGEKSKKKNVGFVDSESGQRTEGQEGKAPKLPDLPPAPFELTVPFRILDHDHHLFLTLGKPPTVEVSTGPRKRASKKLRDAEKVVETKQGLPNIAPDQTNDVLLEEQHKDLEVLASEAESLEASSAKLADNPALLSAAEVPDLPELATDLAEYGQRYRDAELEGATELTTQPIQQTQVQTPQAVVPGTNNPANAYDIRYAAPRGLSHHQLDYAKSNPSVWENLIAMRYVTDVIEPNRTQPLGLQRLGRGQTRLTHPGDNKEYKVPEATYTNPHLTNDADQQDIVLIEATLNPAFFAQNRKGRRLPTGDHKIDQIPRTLNIAAAKWPNARISYLILCNVPPGETTSTWMRTGVFGQSGVDSSRISIEWIVLPVVHDPARDRPTPTSPP